MNTHLTPSDRARVVVVGAGPGGLCAAMLLAGRGFHVTVLEKRPRLGGRSGGLELSGGYRFDVGSTMLMMRFVLEEMFELVGRRLQEEVRIVPVEPMYRLDFGDRSLDMFADTARMREALRAFAPGSEVGLDRFLTHERARLEHLYPVLQRSWPSLASMAVPSVARALPHIGLGHSLYQTASDYFEDPALRLAFSFQAAYLGMSPWDCPGGFGMVPYVEHAWGIDHVAGGIHRVCEAMAAVAQRLGARVSTGVGVDHLRVVGDRATGVVLESGEEVEADAVIINADAAAALLRFVEGDVSMRFSRSHIERLDESCSTFMLYLGLDTQLPLGHHTFFFARDYRAEMGRVFRDGTLDDDLSLYVCNPARSDPTMAPAGHSSVYVLALVPNTRAALDWGTAAPQMRARVIRALEARVGQPIAPHVRAETSLAPPAWARDFQISHGAVFGPAHSIDQLLALRLPNQLPSPHNVFLAGGGTSPGSGLPTIFESGRIAARLICEQSGREFPASRPLPSPVHT